MSRLLVIAGVSLTVGWFAFYYLTKVSEPDIYAHNYFKLPVRAQPVRAGDIMVVPDEPAGITRLCDLNLDTVQLSVAPGQTDRLSVPQTERRIPVACL